MLKLSIKPFAKQIGIITNQTGITFKTKDEDLNLIEEMHLVRNLGLHNQWEVDETYLKNTITKSFVIGKKRLIETQELEKWHSAFVDLVLETSSKLAVLYAEVPNYD